ncbi:hypothetical protein GPJ56_006933 [Histomonas meleagridis]|uniref:uncharacterized protein n=1 Tax=Histomonas meleagridis TaxID=135588 RepID=UPI0035599636|nr:hypothetical protein GPJ56_006933 [Histomonas meleagridis]KAH0800298.1 hypothetical protein GO595_006887 [Histomonas meleagridis]
MKLIKTIEKDHFPASNIYPLILSLPDFHSEINNYYNTTFDYDHINNKIIRRLQTTRDYRLIKLSFYLTLQGREYAKEVEVAQRNVDTSNLNQKLKLEQNDKMSLNSTKQFNEQLEEDYNQIEIDENLVFDGMITGGEIEPIEVQEEEEAQEEKEFDYFAVLDENLENSNVEADVSLQSLLERMTKICHMHNY